MYNVVILIPSLANIRSPLPGMWWTSFMSDAGVTDVKFVEGWKVREREEEEKLQGGLLTWDKNMKD